MRNLTSSEINSILSKKKYTKATRIAVENFLMTLGDNPTVRDAYTNLEMDAELYKWNAPTYRAIMEGIRLAEKLSRP